MLGNEGAGDAHDGILHSPGAGYDGSLISADEMKVRYYVMLGIYII